MLATKGVKKGQAEKALDSLAEQGKVVGAGRRHRRRPRRLCRAKRRVFGAAWQGFTWRNLGLMHG